MTIIIAPDKFKGSLTAFEVSEAITAGIRAVDKNIAVVSFPMADGGDGFATVMKYYRQTENIACTTVDPLNRPIVASYQWNEKTKTAVIEMAVASGLVLLKDDEHNPLLTSSYGTGLLIKDAISRGAIKIILGLGGSATNEGGTGILEALGFQLMDQDNNLLRANGKNLSAIKKILAPDLPAVKFEIACDVQNILYGPGGASYIYAPQKGADAEAVKFLDDGLRNLAAVLQQQTGKEIAGIPGSGAAGGIAVSLMSFFEVELKQGIDMILSVSHLDKEIENADLVITGEGKIDRQSLEGKVIGRIAALATEKNKPVIAFCGKLDLTEEELKQTGISEAYAIGASLSLQESMRNAGKLLEKKAAEVIKNFEPRRHKDTEDHRNK